MRLIPIALLLVLTISSTSFSSKKHSLHPINKGGGNYQFRIDEDFDLAEREATSYNDCTGEVIRLYGSVNLFQHGVYNANKNTLKLMVHQNMQGARGIGDRGTVYTVKYVDNQHQTIHYNKGELRYRQRWVFKLQAKGKSNNLYTTYENIYTVNISTGDVRVEREDFNMECQ